MSEPCSLFSKIHIGKEDFDDFLKSKPKAPKLNNNWLQWWDTRQMANRTELEYGDMYCYDEPSNQLIINDLKLSKHSLTFSEYDLANEVWHFGIIMFTEIYTDMIPVLAFLQSVEEFKKTNTEDFAIVYSYFWGNEDVYASLDFRTGKGLLDPKVQKKSDITTSNTNYAEAYLNKMSNCIKA